MYAKSLAPIIFLCFLSSRFANVLGSSNSTDAAASPAAILEAPTVFQQLYTGGGDDPSAVETVATGVRRTNRSLADFAITEVRFYVSDQQWVKLNINGNGANNNLFGRFPKNIRVIGPNIKSAKFFIGVRKFEEKSDPFYMCGDWSTTDSFGFKKDTFPKQCDVADLPNKGKFSVSIDAWSERNFKGDFATITFNINYACVADSALLVGECP